MGKIQVEGAAYLGVFFFGNLGGIFLYILRQALGLVIVELGVHLINVGLDLGASSRASCIICTRRLASFSSS